MNSDKYVGIILCLKADYKLNRLTSENIPYSLKSTFLWLHQVKHNLNYYTYNLNHMAIYYYYITNNLKVVWKYAQIFVHGHYLL